MKVRRPIKVWGAIFEDGTQVTNDDPNIVSITIKPNGEVEMTYANGDIETHDKKWVSYNPRFN